MPTILSHAAVPLALGVGLGVRVIPRRPLVAGIVCSMVPDLDVYADVLTDAIDHRGITHSLAFALVVAAAAAFAAPALRASRHASLLFIFVATASHGVLDAFTTGGPGVELLWPLTDGRYFMPFQVIEVSPIGITSFFSKRGVLVLASELIWIWPLAILVAAALYLVRRND